MESIKRDVYLQRLKDREQNGLVKIITGIRRCGKSYLLNTLFYGYLKDKGIQEDHIIKISLDDDENSDLLLPKALSRHSDGIGGISYLDKDAFLSVAGDTFRGLAWEIESGGWIK